MRTRKEILADTSVVWEGNFQTSGGHLAILEVLLDIRGLLLADKKTVVDEVSTNSGRESK
jgi:hypothetical protein